MKTVLDQFLDTLEQTQGLYGKLLEMVQQERSAVLASKVDHLNTLLAEKDNVLVQLDALEKQRLQQLHQIAAQMRLPVHKLTLSKIAAASSAHHAQQIHRRRIGLRKLIDTIAKANEENRSMVRHCLNLVQGSLRFLQHCIKPPSVYGATGDIDSNANGGHLVNGAV